MPIAVLKLIVLFYVEVSIHSILQTVVEKKISLPYLFVQTGCKQQDLIII